MADDVSITIGATLAGLTSALTDAQGALSSFKSKVEEALTIGGIALFVDKMAELGVQVERTAATLGTSNEEVLLLQGLARVTGTEMGSLSLALERMYLNIQRSTRDGFNPAAQALKVLGLSARDFIGVPTDQYIDRLHDAVSKFNPSMNLTTALMQVGGRGIQAIIPLLTLQGAAWTELKNRIIEANGNIAAAIPGMAETHANIGILQLSLQSLGATVFSQLKPAFDGIIKSLTDFIQWITKAISAGGSLDKGMNALVFTGKLLASVFASLIALAEGLGVALRAIFDLAAGEIADFDKNAAAAVTRFQAVGKQLKDELTTIWGASARVTISGGLKDAGAIAADAAKAAANQIKIADDMYAELKIKEDAAVKTYQITEAERTEVLKAALKVRMDAEIAAHVDRGVAEAKYNRDLAQLEAQATEKIVADWKRVADQIASDFSSALDQVLAKQKSFGAAMLEMFGKMIEQMIADVVKLIAEYTILNAVAGLAGRTGPTMAGLGAQSGGLIGAVIGGVGAGGGAAQTTAMTALTASVNALNVTMAGHVAVTTSATVATTGQTVAIGTQAAVTGANTVAQSETAASWLANTTATVANTVATWAKAVFGAEHGVWNVPSYQSGTPSVPFTGMALLHPGEMVIPAGPAQDIRDGATMGGGGTQNVSLNINAIDARSIAQMFLSNKNVLNAVLSQIARTNPGYMTGMAQAGGF